MLALTPTTQDTIYQLAAQMMAASPSDADNARIDRAMDLVAGVERTNRPGVFLVRSASEEDRAYTVLGKSCSCADYKRRGACCKHYYATVIFQQLERRDAERQDPTPITIHVQAEESITDLWPVWGGEPCAIELQCSKCHAEPRSTRHRDGLGLACISSELFGGDAA